MPRGRRPSILGPLPAELKDIPGAVAVCGLGPEALPAAPGAVEVDVSPGGPSAAACKQVGSAYIQVFF